MSVTHFDPYFDTDGMDENLKASCGVTYSEEYASGTMMWEDVTCKRCLKMKNRLQEDFEASERHIVRQMGEMVDFLQGVKK